VLTSRNRGAGAEELPGEYTVGDALRQFAEGRDTSEAVRAPIVAETRAYRWRLLRSADPAERQHFVGVIWRDPATAGQEGVSGREARRRRLMKEDDILGGVVISTDQKGLGLPVSRTSLIWSPMND